MVRVWYEPPPYGPRTALNRPAYGLGNEANTPRWLVRLSKLPAWKVIVPFVSVVTVISYIPLIGHKLPYTFSPEYKAAERAYMRYHNMNPIYGISSKEARAADASH